MQVLEAHPFVERVVYPGLASHPQHAIAAKQTSGFGGMITFYIKASSVHSLSAWEALAYWYPLILCRAS